MDLNNSHSVACEQVRVKTNASTRLKLLLLFVYSISVFFVPSWPFMLICALIPCCFAIRIRLSFKTLMPALVSLLLLSVFALVCQLVPAALSADNALANVVADGRVDIWFLTTLRMFALFVASWFVCLSSSSTELLNAFSWFLSPLQILRVSVDDIACTLSLALRFIPLIGEEFLSLHHAQEARGACLALTRPFHSSYLIACTFVSLLLSIFLHAERLSSAMDARCYGASAKRTRLPKYHN